MWFSAGWTKAARRARWELRPLLDAVFRNDFARKNYTPLYLFGGRYVPEQQIASCGDTGDSG
jgi:hypothetical protein